VARRSSDQAGSAYVMLPRQAGGRAVPCPDRLARHDASQGLLRAAWTPRGVEVSFRKRPWGHTPAEQGL